jgi:hypothetical protein
MDHVKILKRAWKILWQYRILWIFGIVLAITTASGAPANGSHYTFDSSDIENRWQITPPDEIRQEFQQLFEGLERIPDWQIAERVVGILIAIVIGFACVILILIVVGVIARNVAEAALIRLVDDYEQTGVKRTFKEGFRMGWSKAAVRLFLINLLTAIPLILIFIGLSILALAPLLLWLSGNPVSGVFGTISTIGMGFLTLLFFIVLGVAVKILLQFVRRASAIGDLDVVEAYKLGFMLVKDNFVAIFLMWLIMLGVQIAAALVMIPIVLLALVVSAIFSGILFLITLGLTGLFLNGVVVWIISAVVAIPIFILILTVTTGFAGGLVKVYESTVWTLTYQELTHAKLIADESDKDEEEEEETPQLTALQSDDEESGNEEDNVTDEVSGKEE